MIESYIALVLLAVLVVASVLRVVLWADDRYQEARRRERLRQRTG